MANTATRVLNLLLAISLAGLALGSALGVKEARSRSLNATIPTLFNANSIWDQKIPSTVAAAAGSSQIIARLSTAPVYIIGVDDGGGVPVYTADASTPMVTVTDSGGNTMQVPLGPGFLPDYQSDGKIVVISGIQAYSLYQLRGQNAGSMAWGDISSTGDGIHNFRNGGSGWGGRASGHNYIAGLITRSELASGVIPHALAVSLPVNLVSTTFVWPAVASDGADSSSSAMLMGARIQLDPTTPLPAGPAARAIYQALIDYGAWVVDTNTDSISFYAEERLIPDGSGVDSSYYSGIATGNELSGLPTTSLRLVNVNQSDFYVNANQPSLLATPTPSLTPTSLPAPTATGTPAPAPSGTNLLSNPGFETGISPWVSWQGLISQSPDAHSGASAATVSYGGGSTPNTYSIGNGSSLEVQNPPAGEIYQATAWVKGQGTTIGKTVRLVIRESGAYGEIETPGQFVPLGGGWQQLSATHAVASSNASGIDVYVVQTNAATGDPFLVDDFSLTRAATQKPLPVPVPSPTAGPNPPPITPTPDPFGGKVITPWFTSYLPLVGKGSN